MNKVTIYFILIFLFSCTNPKTNLIPENFSKKVIPERFSKEWYNLNYSDDDYSVKNENGKLKIHNFKSKNETELKLKNGKLIGKNSGEWGGELLFQPNSKLQKPIKIKDGNIIKIFYFQNKLYFIEGLAHLSLSEGALFELIENGEKFAYKKILDFEDAPEAVVVTKNKIFVASHENFYEIKDFQKKLILKKQFWTSLYPNSIAIFDNENIFIGMRSGIAKLNLQSKVVEFYQEIKN